MNIQLHLYKDSDCDNCKLQQTELMNNPPDADITIFHVKHEFSKDLADKVNVTQFPTIILYNDNIEINRFISFVSSKTINNFIKDYETKCMV